MPHKIRHCERHTIEWTFMLCLVKVSVFFLTAKDYIYRKDELKKVQKILDPLL
jgi:hypothetical protein